MKGNLKNIIFKSLLLMLVTFMVACKDDLPGPLNTEDKMTVLKSIKLVSAGEAGNEVLEGTVDEQTKMVNFPRIDTLTNFSDLRFEVELSDGAQLDKESYSIEFQEGQSSNSFVMKVVNGERFREYIVRLRLLIPLFGADFEKGQVYDFSANPIGNPAYESFVGLNTRGSGFDGENVLVVDRGGLGPHLLKVEDLKENNTNPIPLNITGVTGGTFPYNMGSVVNGHVYMASLSTSGTNPLRVYHWEDPNEDPEMIIDLLPSSIAGAGARHGDNFSISLDNNGDGYIYFIAEGSAALRFTISSYTQVTDTRAVNLPSNYGQWSSYLQAGTGEYFFVTDNLNPVTLVNAGGSSAMALSSSALPNNLTDVRVVEFNEERYLMGVTVARSGSETANLLVYDITRGADLVEALNNFNDNPQSAVFDYNITSTTNIAPGAQTGFKVVKDEDGNDDKLLLYAAHADAGFAIIEFSKKELDD